MKSINNLTMYELSLLQSKTDRSLKASVNSAISGSGITAMEWLLLSAVAKHENRINGVSMSFVAQVLDVSLPQITALTSRLIKSNIIDQKIGLSDKRSRRLLVTKKGYELLGSTSKSTRDQKDQWLGRLNDQEISSYLAILEKLN